MPPSATQSFDKSRGFTCLPSGKKAAELTAPVRPSSVCSAAPVLASQSRTVLSSEQETICLPSGEKAAELTQPVWPLSVCSALLY
jgi:hypothetical protein